MKMFITHEMLLEKNPCKEGYQRFYELFPNGSEYQEALNGLVADNHTDWALWLLEKFGKTNDVIELENFGGKAIVVAGHLRVAGFIKAAFSIAAGGGIEAGGGWRWHRSWLFNQWQMGICWPANLCWDLWMAIAFYRGTADCLRRS